MTRVLGRTNPRIALAMAAVSLCMTAAGQVSTTYHVTNLVADTTGVASNTDPHLVNPWGLTRGASTPWWVSDNGRGVSTLYNASGNPYPLVVTIPTGSGSGTGSPTGTAVLGYKFVFVTLDGTISQWSSGTSAVIKVNNSSKSAMYTGCTVAKMGTAAVLYVANNAPGGAIEAYDTTFHAVTLAATAFMDPTIPAGFTPYNVQNAGGKIYVTFSNGFPGAGNGYVDAFDSSGNLLLRLAHGKWMNEPWGVALAPASFGKFSHALLVGQLGSGFIAAFNPTTGAFVGVLKTSTGNLFISELWGLEFGNNSIAGPSTTLFFTAGPLNYLHGLFGTILPD